MGYFGWKGTQGQSSGVVLKSFFYAYIYFFIYFFKFFNLTILKIISNTHRIINR